MRTKGVAATQLNRFGLSMLQIVTALRACKNDVERVVLKFNYTELG